MTMETFGWIVLGAGSAILARIGVLWLIGTISRRRRSKFNAFVEQLKASGGEFVKDQVHREAMEAGKEVSELTFKDKNGVWNKVRIVVDPALQDLIVQSPPDLEQMIKMGQAGTLEDLMAGHKVEEDKNGVIQEFVFTPNAVKNMRAAGIEPDEVVTKMLKASGRMA